MMVYREDKSTIFKSAILVPLMSSATYIVSRQAKFTIWSQMVSNFNGYHFSLGLMTEERVFIAIFMYHHLNKYTKYPHRFHAFHELPSIR